MCIRQLFEPEEIAKLRAGIESNLAHLSPRANVASGADDPGPLRRGLLQLAGQSLTIGASFSSPRWPQTAAPLDAQHDARACITITCSPRSRGTRQPTPWHQDQPYYNIEGRQNVSFWIPVDPVSRASTLEFVAGSHRGPWLMPRSFMDAQAKWFPEGSLADLPDIEARARRLSHSRLGARAGRCGVLPHADAARRARR